MSRIVSLAVLGGLVIAALAAINVNSVNAREETRFVQFSVLAKDSANYGVDDNPSMIPAISEEIIEEKVSDIETRSTVPIIKYTSLPSESPDPVHKDSDKGAEEYEDHNIPGNNGNGNSNQNQNQNQNNGNNGSNQNNGKEKEREKEKETHPGKSTGKGSANSNANSNANGNANSNANSGNGDQTANPEQ